MMKGGESRVKWDGGGGEDYYFCYWAAGVFQIESLLVLRE